MPVIYVWDPNNTAVYGGFSHNDPIHWNGVLCGTWFNMFLSWALSSHDLDELYLLDPPFPPPNSMGPHMIPGRLNSNSKKGCFYLAKRTGDTTYPFVNLDDFEAAVQNVVSGTLDGGIYGSGTGYLNRPNLLPLDIEWQMEP